VTGKRILVVGAGFAGLYAALGMKRLVPAGHRITVVNPENFMQYQPFLPEVASGTIDPRAVVVPLRRVLRH
jgi:NADH dehydrogenase